MSDTVEKRKLSELRVVDLKQELEKRGKDGNGVKNVLLERLTQALKDEKLDPETHEFEISTPGKTPAKKGKPTKAEEEASEADNSTTAEGDLNLDDMVVQDECNEDEPVAGEAKKSAEGKKVEPKKEEKVEKSKAAGATEADKGGKDETKEADNEDSLNLTIGEEDEKLLHDDSNIESEKKGTNADKNSDAKKTDASEEEKKAEKSDTSSEKTGSTKDEKESAGKSSSSAKSGTSSDSKTKLSPNSNDKAATVSRNLWVSGLSSLTRATDLKMIFSKYGKVIGAKVVTNTRTPGTRCYGYVTMASAKDATECITHLHRTELHGRMISVERAKSDLGPAKPTTGSSNTGSKTESSKAEGADGGKDKDNKDSKPEKKDENGSKPRNSKDRARSNHRGRSQHRSRSQHRGKSAEKDGKPKDEKKKDDTVKEEGKGAAVVARKEGERKDNDRKDNRNRDREVLSLQKIREERERQRLREKERQLREEDRRRRELRQRQREEEQLLRREREKLALERARIEKEKAELLRIERERQKLEREKIELERLELKRQQRKIEEAKRNLKRPATTDHYDDDRKRSAGADRRFEAPPPPSISTSGRGSYASSDKKRLDDYKARDDYKSRPVDDFRRDNYKRNGGGVMDRDMDRPSMPSMDSRYPDNRSGGGGGDYRGSGGARDDRDRNGSAPKSRYMDSMDQRYQDRSGNNGGGGGGNSGPWNAGLPQMSIQPAGMSSADWRMDNGQDRYDRTYNERKAPQMSVSPFMDPSRQNQFMSGGGRPQDRYGAPVSGRFDNGRY